MRRRRGRRKLNVETAESYVVRAARRGADLVALPESFAESSRYYSEAVPSGPVCRRFSKLAAQLKIHLAMGSIGERSGKKTYNTALLFDPCGRPVGKYRKRFPWWPERPRITPGTAAPVFGTKLGRIGLAICWDLAFPEHFRQLALGGADLVVCPAYWQAGDRFGRLGRERARRAARLTRAEDFFINSCVPARAAENSLVMAFVNAAGRTCPNGRPDRLVGLSQVAVPLNGVVRRAGDRPALLIADVDLSWARLGERIYGTRGDVARRGRRRR
jgi:predicted amidohydrolase